jgi:hypothetical protein
MPLTVSSKRLPDEQPWSADALGRRTYEETFEVDQTDAGDMASGVAVAIAAQQLMVGDALPLRGDNYSYGGLTDLDAFALEFSGRRPWPKTYSKRWHITVKYGPPEGDADALVEDDPLLWPPEYWVEWTEESVPLTDAKIVEDLSHIGRPVFSNGPIVNAAGEGTIDAQMKTIYYPVLCCQKAYETLEEIVALNTAYQDSTNSIAFFGSAPRTARYLLTESGRMQRAGQQAVYFGITRIWFKAATWDRLILNNGFMHLRRQNAGGTGDYFRDGNGRPMLHRFMLPQTQFNDDGTEKFVIDEETGKRVYVESPEPANLGLGGLVLPKDAPAINLHYRYLNELPYAGIGIGGGA